MQTMTGASLFDIKPLWSPAQVNLRIHRYIQHQDAPTSVQQAAVETDGALAFQLNDLAQYATFTALYDQYRIRQLDVKMIPAITAYLDSTGGAAKGFNSRVWTAIDYDDATALTAVALREYTTVRENMGTDMICRSFVPHFALAAYSGAFNSYANTIGWLDCNSAGVQHYGFKWAIEAAPAATSVLQSWRFDVTYYFEFRNVR